MAKLYFRYGAMNCGKTTALMQVAHNYLERGMRPIILKPQVDSKAGMKIESRLGIQKEVDYLVSKEENIYEIVEKDRKEAELHCVLVDEAQFFNPEQIDQLFMVAVKQGIPVICYGLRTDFLMNGFPGSARLLLIAHSIEELKTICACGKKALINGRKINGKFVFEGKQVAIDGDNKVEYEPLCPECYLRFKENR
ncbi:thymidine kinase [Clostridia bacterium]|nr:thymidine kinase [Clostridia bacterium]